MSVLTADDVCLGVSPEAVQKLVKELLENHDPTKSSFVTQEEYLMWTLHNPLSTALLDIIFQVCCIWHFEREFVVIEKWQYIHLFAKNV